MRTSPLLDPHEAPVLDLPDLFLQSVPRTLVHRAAVSEVLVTGMQEGDGDDHFRVGVQWPRSHSYYGRVANRWHDPMLLGESIRQALLAVAHQAYGTPLGHKFLSSTHTFRVDQEGALLTERPAHILLDVRAHNLKRRGGALSRIDLAVDCYRDGRLIGSGTMAAQCVAEPAYRRLRGERVHNVPGPPLPEAARPGVVGRASKFDVVLGESRVDRIWPLRYDRDHPVLFDHPVDHVPGMVLMEAARQAALAALGRPDGLLTACDTVFHRYVEFDSTCLVTATRGRTRGATRPVSVSFNQGGATVAGCEVEILAT